VDCSADTLRHGLAGALRQSESVSGPPLLPPLLPPLPPLLPPLPCAAANPAEGGLVELPLADDIVDRDGDCSV
jgi:hypothetical protein